MNQFQGYKKLIVYQRMIELIKLIYEVTSRFPETEKYGLTSQMRRAGVSIVSNFTEGYLKKSNKEKSLFLERSVTSLHELIAQTDISQVLGYIKPPDYLVVEDKMGEVGYLLDRYRQKVI
jgi:four helix bundle protein